VTNITLILGASSIISFYQVNVIAVESIMFYVPLSSLSIRYMIGANESIRKKGAVFLYLIHIAFVLQLVTKTLLLLVLRVFHMASTHAGRPRLHICASSCDC
jgi:hypothetical protein